MKEYIVEHESGLRVTTRALSMRQAAEQGWGPNDAGVHDVCVYNAEAPYNGTRLAVTVHVSVTAAAVLW